MATRDEPTNATGDPAGKPPRTDKKPRTDKHPRTRLDPDARRAAILEAAMELFAERPYTEVPIAAIARQAGASDALVYRYFAGKDELYAEVVRRAIGRLGQRQAEVLEALPAGVPTRDRVRAATLVYLDYVAEHPASWATPFTAPGAEPGAAAAERAQARGMGSRPARHRGQLQRHRRRSGRQPAHLLAPPQRPRNGGLPGPAGECHRPYPRRIHGPGLAPNHVPPVRIDVPTGHRRSPRHHHRFPHVRHPSSPDCSHLFSSQTHHKDPPGADAQLLALAEKVSCLAAERRSG